MGCWVSCMLPARKPWLMMGLVLPLSVRALALSSLLHVLLYCTVEASICLRVGYSCP